MSFLAYVVAMTLAQADPAPPVPPTQAAGLIVSVGVGVGAALGKVDDAAREGTGTLGSVSKSLPFTIAAGYRFDPRWSADLNLTYAPVVLAGGCAEYFASASETHLGAALRWHRPSQRIVRPWISLGLGYDRYRYKGGCPDVDFKGVDLDFQVGGDIRVTSSWTIGPFASARVGTYVHRYVQGHSRSSGGPVDEAISAGDLALHEWFSMGLRGTFDSAPSRGSSAVDTDYRSGLLFMPFAGAHRPAGDAFDLGLRVGFLAGYHVLPGLSGNGELAVDLLNVNNVSDQRHVKAHVADVVLAPLYHLQFAPGELVVGPRIGVFRSAFADFDHEETARGLAYGMNVGVFGSVGDMGMGVLLAYTRRHTTGTDVKPELSSHWWSVPWWSVPDVLSATVAALF
jgi:hypothetical protein